MELHHHRVLVVEDDADCRDAVTNLLESEGYAVTGAEDGQVALDRLREGLDPCVILLDLMMPVKDGWQFRAEQRVDPALADIPTIIVSAQSGAIETARALSLTALEKPPDPDALMKLLGEYCGGGVPDHAPPV